MRTAIHPGARRWPAASVSFVLAVLGWFGAQPALADDAGPFGRSGSWTRIFSEEFDGPALDSSKWTVCYWWNDGGCTNAGNNDMQWYLPGNVQVGDGQLHLIARDEPATGRGRAFPYTSGMVTTGAFHSETRPAPRFEAQYGYFEMRAKLPGGKGLFPAFWLSPSNNATTPEIDIVETIGQEPDILTTNFHYLQENGKVRHIGHRSKTVDLSSDWHIYGLLWRSDALIWYLDGIEQWRFTKVEHVPRQPMYILLTLAVGGNWPGPPNKATRFPAEFAVDYVRVWQRADP